MKLKKFAMRGLVILAITVALCMFFARTVQTITTPKVRLVSGDYGRLENKLQLQGEIFFPEVEEISLADAKQNAITVERVLVKPGDYVYAGDKLMTAQVSGLDEKRTQLQTDYNTKQDELTALDITNRKASRESRQNELYEEMIALQRSVNEKKNKTRLSAAKEKIMLSSDVTNWTKELAAVSASDTLTEMVNDVLTENKRLEAATAAFYAIFEDRKLRVKDEVFNYIKDRTKILREMNQLSSDMVELEIRAESLTTITAPRDGWIAELKVNEGDQYDGGKPLYTMAKEGTNPGLRASLQDVKLEVTEGTKVVVKQGDDERENTTVERIQVTAKGKYAVIVMPEFLSGSNHTLQLRSALENGVEVTISQRARQSSTLLPAAAVRQDGEASYIYLVNDVWGGFLQSSGMKVVKSTVTVLGKNDKQVAVSEDFSYQRIAYQEDRALTDGAAVMEYVQ